MSASEEELCDGQDRSRDLLALLPAPLLLNSVLPCLDPADLVRLGCCCGWLRAAAFADDVWRPRCEALGWGGFPRGTSWQAGFSSRRRTLCAECGRPSRYVFALLGCRLCEKCEHGSPRYGLVTALEAAERYGVPYAALAALSYHEACRTRFYLRSAVEAIARGSGGVGRKQLSEGNGSEEEEEEGEAPAQCAGSDDSSNDEGGGSYRAGRGSTAADLRRAEEKAARKAAKKAAKEAQRLKRQGRNTPGAGVGGGAGGGRRQQRQQQQQSAAGVREGPAPHSGGPRRGGGGAAAAAAPAPAGSSPPSGRRRAPGPLLLVQDDGDDGAALPLEGQAVPLHRSRARGGGHGGSGGGSGGGSRATAVKLKSGWAAEREALMAAWGQFGISGLVLAS